MEYLVLASIYDAEQFRSYLQERVTLVEIVDVHVVACICLVSITDHSCILTALWFEVPFYAVH